MRIDELESPYSGCSTFKFGDSQELCNRLLSLVRTEKKVATCGALREYEAENEPIPEIGQISIALNMEGDPELAIVSTSISITRFCDVDESFALAEGENESLEGWQDDHKAFFDRNGGWENDMKLVCERFRLVADFARANR